MKIHSYILSLVGIGFLFSNFITVAEANDQVQIAESSGKAFLLKAKSNLIVWKKCQDFSVIENEADCKTVTEIKLSENYLRAFYYFWLKTDSPKKGLQSVSEDELALVRQVLKGIESFSGKTLYETQVSAKNEIATKVDYYKNFFPDSVELAAQLKLLEEIESKNKAIIKIEKIFDEAMILLKSEAVVGGLTMPKAESVDLAQSFFSTLSWYLDQQVLKPEIQLTENMQRQSVKTPQKAPVKTAAKSTQPKTLPAVKPVASATSELSYSDLSLAEYFKQIQATLVYPKPLLFRTHDLCVLDFLKSKPLQCFLVNGAKAIPFTVVPQLTANPFTGRYSFISSVSEWHHSSPGLVLLQENDHFHLISSENNSNFTQLFKQAEKDYKELNITHSFTNHHYYTLLLDINGKSYINQMRGGAELTSAGVLLDMGPGATGATFYYQSGQMLICYLQSEKVVCQSKAFSNDQFLKAILASPASASSGITPALELPGVNKVQIANYNANFFSLCTANNTEFNCITSNVKAIRKKVDASLGFYAAYFSSSPIAASQPEDLTVCAHGIAGLKCYFGAELKEVNFRGLTDNPEIQAVTIGYRQICGYDGKKVICRPEMAHTANDVEIKD